MVPDDMQWSEVSAVAVLRACQESENDSPTQRDNDEIARDRYACEEANAITSDSLWSVWDDDQVGLSLCEARRDFGY